MFLVLRLWLIYFNPRGMQTFALKCMSTEVFLLYYILFPTIFLFVFLNSSFGKVSLLLCMCFLFPHFFFPSFSFTFTLVPVYTFLLSFLHLFFSFPPIRLANFCTEVYISSYWIWVLVNNKKKNPLFLILFFIFLFSILLFSFLSLSHIFSQLFLLHFIVDAFL